MASEKDIAQAKADVKKLGILNIEAMGDLPSDVLVDTVKAVESVNLDFKAWKKIVDEHKGIVTNG